LNITNYKAIFFDCDGVILNSNKIKTQAFKSATSGYGESLTNDLISYHLLNGGISRYEKFNYFLSNIYPISSDIKRKAALNNLLDLYSKDCLNGLLKSEVTYGLKYFREITYNIPWFIVSGGDQSELNYVFKKKLISKYFDGGIFGSPDSKDKIIKREIKRNDIRQPSLFLGDSKLDHQVSILNCLDFIFVSKWTEFNSYRDYCNDHSIKIISRIYDLCLDS
tara:strand:- start:767 stop:1432 length:666 start_codon:yes stop_codon:yes gene_type:complete